MGDTRELKGGDKRASVHTDRMAEMPMGRLIISMSWPAMLSMMLQALYNVVDSFFVSHISEEALTVVTYIFPFQLLIISVGVGTGVGINSLISRRLGARLYDEADMAANHGYRLSFVNWAVFAVLGGFFSDEAMSFMSDIPYVIDNGTVYMRMLTIGSLFVLVQLSTEKILQATGNMKLPMICSVAGVVINIGLDPLLIFGIGIFPEMGVSGAAVATLIAQAISMILGQIVLFRGSHSVKVSLTDFRFCPRIIREIYAVGFPNMLMQSIFSVMQFGLNMILGGLNETAVAVNGVYGRLQSFVFMPVFGLNQGVLPILGYSFGARNRERFMSAFRKGLAIAMVILAAGFAVFQIFPDELVEVFNSKGSEEMMSIGVPALRIISICFIPAAFGIMVSSLMQATAHGFISLWGALLRQLVGILPLAWIFARTGGLDLVWWSFPAAEIIGVTYFIIALSYVYRKEIKRLDIVPDNTY